MRNISISSVASDAEGMMRSLLGKAESDAERERDKHPRGKKTELDADTRGPDKGQKELEEEAAAAEADAADAAIKAGLENSAGAGGVPQTMLDMSRELQLMNAEMINLGPQRTMELMLQSTMQGVT